jgi:hypothetical protein
MILILGCHPRVISSRGRIVKEKYRSKDDTSKGLVIQEQLFRDTSAGDGWTPDMTFILPMHLLLPPNILSDTALCISVRAPCTFCYSPMHICYSTMHLLLQPNAPLNCTMHLLLCTSVTAPYTFCYIPMHLLLQHGAPFLIALCTFCYSTVHLQLLPSAQCTSVTAPCTFYCSSIHAASVTPCNFHGSTVHHIPSVTVSNALRYCPTTLLLQHHPPV